MEKIKVAVIGYGNIGQYVVEALQVAPDFEIVGIVRRNANDIPFELKPFKVVDDISKLEKPDVAIIASPSREVEKVAKGILFKGINTVDSFDIHANIVSLRRELGIVAKENNAVAIISSGWDPGTDSMIRALLDAIAPKGITYTNFGPGMSMGHTVCVKSKKGVKNALSMTIPMGTSVHRRMVYVELEEGVSLEEVTKSIKEDPYFSSDETHVFKVPSVDALKDMGHGVNLTRKGVSGKTQNQLFEFNMKINNPALTAQILVCAARATMKQNSGAYTLIEIPIIDMLYGEKEDLIKRLV